MVERLLKFADPNISITIAPGQFRSALDVALERLVDEASPIEYTIRYAILRQLLDKNAIPTVYSARLLIRSGRDKLDMLNRFIAHGLDLTMRGKKHVTLATDLLRIIDDRELELAKFLIANGADRYVWTPSLGLNTITGSIVVATPSVNTTYTVTGSLNGCTSTSQSAITVIDPPRVNAGNDIRICRGQSIQLKATGANNWLWGPTQTLSCFSCSDPIASPKITTVYTAKGNNGSCEGVDSIKVEVIQPFRMSISKDTFVCIGEHVQLEANGANKYLWQPGIGLNRDDVPNPIANPSQTILYKIIGTDQYSCFSDTQFIRVIAHPLPTVDLGYGSTVIAGTQITLNPVINSIDPVNYYKWTPAKDLSCDNCKNPVATINNNVIYTLNIKSIYGCSASDTIHFKVNCDPSQVFIPNAFSPDGDGVNDVLMIRAKGVAQIKYFRIYNRWGQLVFERSNITANDPSYGWDGKVNGMPSNPDVYVYAAEVACSAGNTYIYKGNVTLLK